MVGLPPAAPCVTHTHGAPLRSRYKAVLLVLNIRWNHMKLSAFDHFYLQKWQFHMVQKYLRHFLTQDRQAHCTLIYEPHRASTFAKFPTQHQAGSGIPNRCSTGHPRPPAKDSHTLGQKCWLRPPFNQPFGELSPPKSPTTEYSLTSLSGGRTR